MSRQPSAPLMMALMTRNMTSTKSCLRLMSERVSSTRVRCSIKVIERASCMETRLDHRRSVCSNFINKVRSRPGGEPGRFMGFILMLMTPEVLMRSEFGNENQSRFFMRLIDKDDQDRQIAVNRKDPDI